MKSNKKTALVLGGGGARGAYEIGVWQALRELGIRIDIVCGTSVGSVNGAMIVQDEFDLAVKLWQELDTSMIFDLNLSKQSAPKASGKKNSGRVGRGISLDEAGAYAREFLKKGGASASGLAAILDKYIDEEAIRSSPIEYGLTTVELPTLAPHYLYKEEIPSGKIADYIIASSSIAPAVQPHKIDGIDYIDGGFADVVPLELALNKGAENIIAVNLQAVGILRREKFKEAEESADFFEIITSAWDLGNVLVFDRSNSRRLMRLGYLDTMKTFRIFSGNFYTFPHRSFDKKTLIGADYAAKLFELDPTVIYTKDSLNETLADKIKAQRRIMKRELLRKDNHTLLDDSKPFKLRISESVNLLGEKLSRKSFAIQIADELKKEPDNHLLTSRAASKLIREELAAAHYLAAHIL